MEMLYAGLDVHRDSLYGTILDRQGGVVAQGGFPSRKEALQCFFAGIPSSGLRVAIEACGFWRAAYKMLAALGYEVVLSNPVKTHQIACRKKTDKVDSRILADLLRTDYLPEVYIPSEDVIRLRDIARHRARLVRIRSSLQCKIKAYLQRDGVPFNGGWSKKNLELLKSMDPRIANFVRLIEAANEEIKLVTREINTIAMNKRLSVLLQTAPGIGKIASLMILGEIGDIRRFEEPKSVVNKACNKWLKWIVSQNAQAGPSPWTTGT